MKARTKPFYIFTVLCLAWRDLMIADHGALFVKILYLTNLAQKLLSLRIYSYLCADLIISGHI